MQNGFEHTSLSFQITTLLASTVLQRIHAARCLVCGNNWKATTISNTVYSSHATATASITHQRCSRIAALLQYRQASSNPHQSISKSPSPVCASLRKPTALLRPPSKSHLISNHTLGNPVSPNPICSQKQRCSTT